MCRKTFHQFSEVVAQFEGSLNVALVVGNIARVDRLRAQVVGERPVTTPCAVWINDGISVVGGGIDISQQIAVAAAAATGLVAFGDTSECGQGSLKVVGDVDMNFRREHIAVQVEIGIVVVLLTCTEGTLLVEVAETDKKLCHTATTRYIEVIRLRDTVFAQQLVGPVHVRIEIGIGPVLESHVVIITVEG